MHAASFSTIEPNAPIHTLPLTLTQTASRTGPLALLLIALPAALAVLGPYWMLVSHAASQPDVLTNRTGATAQTALALLLWGALFAWPIWRRTMRIAARRDIEITSTRVLVNEASLYGSRTWSEPLAAYRGIAHHVRSSLGGTRHELLLIHPEPSRSLLLRAADRIAQSEIDDLGKLLGCREIAPQVFYRNTDPVQQQSFPNGQTGLAGA